MIKLSVNQKIGKHEIDILNEFLKKSINDLEKRPNIYWAEGYLCAIISSPNIIMPSEWQGELIDQDYKFENEEQFCKIYSLLTSFYNNINKSLIDEAYIPIYEWYETKGETILESSADWATGYIFGTMFASKEFLTGEVLDLFGPIVALTGIIREDELKKNNVCLDEIIYVLPLALQEIRATFKGLEDEALPREYRTLKPIVNSEKVGRNELYSCGSGKKYKKCCLNNDIT